MSRGDPLDELDIIFGTMLVLLVIFIPLGMWKLVEIVLWVFNNVTIQIGS